MDLAVTLVKSVMRAFYNTREILVVDALILHEALRDDDLSYLMSMNTKDLHKVCGKLREERFITVHTRSELRPGNPRPSSRTWYYINYRNTIDAIKWRMYTIGKEVQGASVVVTEKKEYFCSFCKAEWTAMEVLDSSGPEGFLCHRCHHVLTPDTERNTVGHEQSTRLNDQFKFITELLPQIDSVHIPECDFDRALSKARPVERDATHQRMETIPVDGGANRPMAVKGLTNVGPQSIAVNISTSEGASEAEKEAERARKEKIAQQNALPSWMSNSTVTGESFTADAVGAATLVPKTENDDAVDTKDDEVKTNTQIDDIFERLKAEQAEQRRREQEQDEDEDEYGSDEDEDNFEDVPATGSNSALGTPAIKREGSHTTSREGDSSDERAAKRPKIEPQIKTEDSGEDSVEDDDDEDMEFEDV